jgi:hypothetical protein
MAYCLIHCNLYDSATRIKESCATKQMCTMPPNFPAMRLEIENCRTSLESSFGLTDKAPSISCTHHKCHIACQWIHQMSSVQFQLDFPESRTKKLPYLAPLIGAIPIANKTTADTPSFAGTLDSSVPKEMRNQVHVIPKRSTSSSANRTTVMVTQYHDQLFDVGDLDPHWSCGHGLRLRAQL